MGDERMSFVFRGPLTDSLPDIDTLATVSPARIAIDGTDPIRMRAASALAADHRVDQVGILGRTPPGAWGERAVAITTPDGWDITVGISTGVSVTVGEGGAVSWAGPSGLARSLGERLGGVVRLAGTVPGQPLDSELRFGFPPPLDWLGGELVDGIHHCPTRGSLAAVMAVDDRGRALVVLDDRGFLDGALLAAGVLLAAEGHRGPVWETHQRYIELLTELGLVLADRAS